MNPFSAILLSMLSVAVVAASAPTKPAPPKAPAAQSKYQRAHLEQLKISAPGDEYFGRMKMSFLGVNNTLRDAAITAGDHTTDSGVISKVAFAIDALRDWEKRYPRDPQLARSYYLAITVDKKIWVQANQQQAWLYMNRIADVFPSSYFGKLIKREIAIGFTEHYYAVPEPCRTPSPTASQEPTVPVPVVTASPSPEPTPSPSPAPTQVAKGLKVQVLTPPCVAAPSPTPVPTESPVVSPIPATGTPAPLTASPAPSTASPAPWSAPPASSSSPRATAFRGAFANARRSGSL